MKVAIIHEWLTIIGGSEKVFQQIAKLYPEADIFTLVAIPGTITKLELEKYKIHTSFIQRLPFSEKKYRSYFPLFPLAIESFDLSSYDLIISSSHAVAKGALTFSHQLHVCYCHSPVRYVWDLHHQYLVESKLNRGFKGFIVKYLLQKMRIWDITSTNRVDYFIANSNYVAKRIKKNYGRESVVIHPNVEIEEFDLVTEKEDYYVTCSRMVPYKRIDLIVEAFIKMPEKKLYVIGDGPDFEKIKKIATSNTVLLGNVGFDSLKSYLSKAKAFVFAAEEDFGIVPVEAMACGTPVIAFGKGGVTETVIDGETGILYYQQNVKGIIAAIDKFEKSKFNPLEIRKNAERFSTEKFVNQFTEFLQKIGF